MLSRVKRRLKRFAKRLRSLSTKAAPPAAPRKRQRWSIGIYTGDSPFRFFPHEQADNPVLTVADVSDVHAAFVADPFILNAGYRWYMFFEVMNEHADKGEIGLAVSEDGLKWAYRQIVLAEPFHITYPYVFEWMNNYYMIPESHQAGAVRLYQALEFPMRWSHVGTLLSGGCYSDSSIVRYRDKWWLFTETSPSFFGTLRLYYADDLMGPWHEHPHSPIIKDDRHIARPGGRVLVADDRLIRYAQDCYPKYGTQVRAFEVTELTTTSYQEQETRESPVLQPTGSGWNGLRMHHIDPHLLEDGRWLACVDGFGLVNTPDEYPVVKV